MRLPRVALLASVMLAPASCRPDVIPPPTTPARLQDAIIGKWRGSQDDYTVTYEFHTDGSYTRESGTVQESGKWQVVDDKQLELTYTLTKEQAEAAKPIWKATVDVLKKVPKFPGAPERPLPPEPKVGENKVAYNASVDGDVLTWGAVAYRRMK
jgi:hypothetical protein